MNDKLNVYNWLNKKYDCSFEFSNKLIKLCIDYGYDVKIENEELILTDLQDITCEPYKMSQYDFIKWWGDALYNRMLSVDFDVAMELRVLMRAAYEIINEKPFDKYKQIHNECRKSNKLYKEFILPNGTLTNFGIIYGNDLETSEVNEDGSINALNYFIVPLGKDFNSGIFVLWCDVECVGTESEIVKDIPYLFNKLNGLFDEIDFYSTNEKEYVGDVYFYKNNNVGGYDRLFIYYNISLKCYFVEMNRSDKNGDSLLGENNRYNDLDGIILAWTEFASKL